MRFQLCGMCYHHSPRSACTYTQSDQGLLVGLIFSFPICLELVGPLNDSVYQLPELKSLFFSDTNILFHVFSIKAQCVVLAPVALFEQTW